MIKVEGLTKRYARTVAVDNISFEVEKGGIIGFLGPNGAGKTTTMRILTCFLPPTSGSATVAGFEELEEPAEGEKRDGHLAQTPAALSGDGNRRIPNLRGQTQGAFGRRAAQARRLRLRSVRYRRCKEQIA